MLDRGLAREQEAPVRRRAKSNDEGESHGTFQCRSPVVENAKNCVAKARSRTCQKKQASSDVLWGGPNQNVIVRWSWKSCAQNVRVSTAAEKG